MSPTTPGPTMERTTPEPTTPTPLPETPTTTSPASPVPPPPPTPPPPPPEIPPESILIRIHFDLPPHLPAHQRASWYSMNLTMSLMAPLSELSFNVQAACDTAANMNKNMLEEEFYSKGKDLSGVARIVFEGDQDRAEFVGSRVQCVGDLFTAMEVKRSGVVTVRVEMKVVEKGKKKRMKMSGDGATWRVGGIADVGASEDDEQVQRRGTFPLPLQQNALSAATADQHSHSQMIQAIVLTDSGVLGVPAREMGELLIGSIEDAIPPPYDLQEVPKSEYLDEADSRIPELPALTFGDYVPGNDNDTSAVADHLETNGKRIEVAVRLVSRFSNQEKAKGKGKLLLLPANVVLSVKHCAGQKKLICERLRAELKRFAASGSPQDSPEQQHQKKTLLSVLFDGKQNIANNRTGNEKKEKSTPAWDFHLFVLPQVSTLPSSSPSPSSSSATPSLEQSLFVQQDESTSPPPTPPQEHEYENQNRKPKLYPFKGGSLSRFLHSSAVIPHDNTRLYMEAHIVPREVEDEEVSPEQKKKKKNNKVIVVNITTASSSSSASGDDDDDGENGRSGSLEDSIRIVREVLEEASWTMHSSSTGEGDALGGNDGESSSSSGGGHHDELE